MAVFVDAELYHRGAATLVASWEAYARGAAGAEVQYVPGVAAAVFPHGSERGVYNNALLERNLETAERADALDTMEAAYVAAGVTHYAAWVHESDTVMRGDIERRGFTFDSSTRAMGMMLDDLSMPRPGIEIGSVSWSGYLRLFG